MFLDSEWLPRTPKHLLKPGSVPSIDDVFESPVFAVQPAPLHEIGGTAAMFADLGVPNSLTDPVAFLRAASKETLDQIKALNAVVPVLVHLEERAQCEQEVRFAELDKVDGDEALLPDGAEKSVAAKVAKQLGAEEKRVAAVYDGASVTAAAAKALTDSNNADEGFLTFLSVDGRANLPALSTVTPLVIKPFLWVDSPGGAGAAPDEYEAGAGEEGVGVAAAALIAEDGEVQQQQQPQRKFPVPIEKFKNGVKAAKAASSQALDRINSGIFRLLKPAAEASAVALTTDKQFRDQLYTPEDLKWYRYYPMLCLVCCCWPFYLRGTLPFIMTTFLSPLLPAL